MVSVATAGQKCYDFGINLRALQSTSGANGGRRVQWCPPRITLFLLIFLHFSSLFCLTRAHAQEAQISEYKVKAAFVFNFTKFVDWPQEAFGTTDAPLTIGILRENPFGSDLDEIIRNKTVNNRTLKTRLLHSVAECTNCNVLFLSTAEKGRIKEVLEKLHDASILTVSETDGFTEAGGMINFVREGNKFRFQINNEAAKRAKLKISSKMLGLALPTGH